MFMLNIVNLNKTACFNILIITNGAAICIAHPKARFKLHGKETINSQPGSSLGQTRNRIV